MDFFSIISEDRIKKAYENKEFEKLPGLGKPLPYDDLASVPEDLRMAYRVLKNSGFAEEDNHLKQEILTIEDLIRKCEDPDEKEQLKKKWNEKMLRFNSVMAKRGKKTNSSLFKNYEQKINKKIF
ncbi:DUF1992 domain-containing protein [Bacillus sp. S/N-304-OC-R1]|uniref:DnaJ family domain-containing protein n=1 Tax=Bacillus sp. S/N-304-OC-R1 TaxID=2758034 RepID=UPI001C8E17B0|nr:DUF1992 domain-containing protein [Bacillus sp. S/N-304-OC-R1]MBY0122956.1 DUF1992 domain-containing protein [Bacillus sp. S/N-304-OC-R1]